MSLLHSELSGEIIGAAMDVLNELRPGLDEKIYERALVLELLARGHATDQQCPFPVRYRSQLVGTLIPDLIVDGKIVVDTKVVASFNQSHVAQMVGYLAITGLDLGLLVNFKYATLKWKRIVKERSSSRRKSADDESL